MSDISAGNADSAGAFTVAAVLGATGVALGAFGAHGIKGWLSAAADGAQRLQWWETATSYHLWHAALAAVFAIMIRRAPRARIGLGLCTAGIVIFSGSLYAMTLSNIRVLGAITPIGGLFLIAAWVFLAVAARAGR